MNFYFQFFFHVFIFFSIARSYLPRTFPPKRSKTRTYFGGKTAVVGKGQAGNYSFKIIFSKSFWNKTKTEFQNNKKRSAELKAPSKTLGLKTRAFRGNLEARRLGRDSICFYSANHFSEIIIIYFFNIAFTFFNFHIFQNMYNYQKSAMISSFIANRVL